MSVIGVHTLVYTSEPEKVRAVLRDVFGWKHVDAGGGWLIFKTPPAEMGVHPAEGPTFEGGTRHLVSFMCDNLDATMKELRAKGIEFDGEPQDEGYGITIQMRLPGDLEVMLYEPRHPTALNL
jgi:hypothetical protein